MKTRPPVAYRIETNRLVIRCYQQDDAAALKHAIDSSLDHLLPWMPWAKFEPETLLAKRKRIRNFRRAFLRGTDYTYGIFSIDDETVLGGTGLHCRIGAGAREIGYWVRADVAGQGIATEAAAALTRAAFEISRVNRVEIHCDPRNESSARIPRKLGYELQTVIPRRIAAATSSPRDTMIWSMREANLAGSFAAQQTMHGFNRRGERIAPRPDSAVARNRSG